MKRYINFRIIISEGDFAMTIEEKALMIEKYCDSIDECSECAIRNSKFTCYGQYDLYPEEIEKNYNIIYGNE